MSKLKDYDVKPDLAFKEELFGPSFLLKGAIYVPMITSSLDNCFKLVKKVRLESRLFSDRSMVFYRIRTGSMVVSREVG